jgi:hypothetical protein
MRRQLALLSNVFSTTFCGGTALFFVAIGFPVWAWRPADLMSPGPAHAWHEYALGYGIAVPVAAFFYLVPAAILMSWLFYVRGRRLAAAVTGWVPLACPLLTLSSVVATLVLLNL